MDDLKEELISYILPEGLLDYFDITSVTKNLSKFVISISEKKLKPEEVLDEKIHSNGFFNEAIIKDFPLRGRKVYFKVKRRRWEYQNRGGCFARDLTCVAKGTRLDKEFATFLKELPR